MNEDHNPCECAAYEVEDGSRTQCEAATQNTFAPGHDAKLKSLLIYAGIRRLEIKYPSDGNLVSTSAVAVANKYGFGYLVVDGIARGEVALNTREARKAERKPKLPQKEKASKGELALPIEGFVSGEASVVDGRIRIGVNEFDAELLENGDAVYTNARGEERVAREGTFTKVK